MATTSTESLGKCIIFNPSPKSRARIDGGIHGNYSRGYGLPPSFIFPIYFVAASLVLELELEFRIGVQGFMIRVWINARLGLGFKTIGKVRVSRFMARAQVC